MVTLSGVAIGWRDLRRACTASKVLRSMIAGTAMTTTSSSGFFALPLKLRVLKRCSPV